MKKLAVFLLLLVLFSAPVCLAHGGSLDSSGGHWDRSTGTYHYHSGIHTEGSSSGSSSDLYSNGTYYRTTANVNMRSSASGSSTILQTIPEGSRAMFAGIRNGNWIKLSYNGKTGWCHANYLAKVPSAVATAKPVSSSSSFGSSSYFQIETSVNMRLEPSQTSKMITTIPKGAAVEYIGTYDDWVKVYYNYNAGYVLAKYLVSMPGSNNSLSEPIENSVTKHESNQRFWKTIGVTPMIIISAILAGAGVIVCSLMCFFIIRGFVGRIIGIFKKD